MNVALGSRLSQSQVMIGVVLEPDAWSGVSQWVRSLTISLLPRSLLGVTADQIRVTIGQMPVMAGHGVVQSEVIEGHGVSVGSHGSWSLLTST